MNYQKLVKPVESVGHCLYSSELMGNPSLGKVSTYGEPAR